MNYRKGWFLVISVVVSSFFLFSQCSASTTSVKETIDSKISSIRKIQVQKYLGDYFLEARSTNLVEDFSKNLKKSNSQLSENFKKNISKETKLATEKSLDSALNKRTSELFDFIAQMQIQESLHQEQYLLEKAEVALSSDRPFSLFYLNLFKKLSDNRKFILIHEKLTPDLTETINFRLKKYEAIFVQGQKWQSEDHYLNIQTAIDQNKIKIVSEPWLMDTDSFKSFWAALNNDSSHGDNLPSMKSPKGTFLWGVSTAGYQWEGYNSTSQWLPFEMASHTKELCGKAADGQNKYKEDIQLAKNMGLNAFRTSIEWSKIEPLPGIIDQKAVDFYHSMFQEMKKNGLTPVVTLVHFSYPAWLDSKYGGWESSKSVEPFSRYVDFVSREYASEVDWWLTFNEPEVFLGGAYFGNFLPPAKGSPLKFFEATRNWLLCNSKAYEIIHRNDPVAMVSFNHYAASFDLTNIFSRISRNNLEPGKNFFLLLSSFEWILAKLANCRDFVALDYYTQVDYNFFQRKPWEWTVYPEGFYDVLKSYYNAFHLPILVAENGFATQDLQPRADSWTREASLIQHVKQMQRAQKDGIPILGYIHWSITDNWEWGTFSPRFGLYSVDCRKQNFERIPTPAVKAYKEIVKSNGVTNSLEANYPSPQQ
ncbi:MAG: glycoside hydrolase family 1 protein [Candidatus Riflebacteria bacterium]|nr:glycoside hydrolase family 1 protein [Candidatus Riflebacteria bacterium]